MLKPISLKKKIIIFRGGAIGDFILTLPAIAAIRKHFKNYQINLFANSNVADLAEEYVDQLFHLDSSRFSKLFTNTKSPEPDLADLFSNTELVISYLSDPKGVFHNNIKSMTNSQIIQCQPKPDESNNIHAADFYLSPLKALGITPSDKTPRITINYTQPLTPKPDNPCMAFHPGSGSKKKNWPIECWLELIKSIRDKTNWHLIGICGEAEAHLIPLLSKFMDPQRFHLFNNLKLKDLAIKLSSADIYIGHDSGITHLAAAIGLKGIVLWAKSNYVVWHPVSKKFNTLFLNDNNYLKPEIVLQELQNLITPP